MKLLVVGIGILLRFGFEEVLLSFWVVFFWWIFFNYEIIESGKKRIKLNYGCKIL